MENEHSCLSLSSSKLDVDSLCIFKFEVGETVVTPRIPQQFLQVQTGTLNTRVEGKLYLHCCTAGSP